MEDEKKKQPTTKEVYCISGNILTSKGRMFHGDRKKLPIKEADKLIAQGWVK